MTKPFDPYTPPTASPNEAPTASQNDSDDWAMPGVRREGKILVMRLGALLPPRCVRCNCAAQKPAEERTASWLSPWLYPLLLLNPFVVALMFRKTARVHPGLCPTHQRQHMMIQWLGIAGTFVLLIAILGAFGNNNPRLGWLLLPTFFAVWIFAAVKSRLFTIVKITREEAHLKGCGDAFLDSLPDH